MNLKIIYVYDAICAWCYGFSPVMLGIYENFSHEFEFEVLSGGMILGDRVNPAGEEPAVNSGLYKMVEETTGINFGLPFLHNLESGNMVFNSEIPAIALSVFKSIAPSKAVEFVHHIQNSIYFDGKDPADPELYRYLAVNYSIDPDEFESKMQDPLFKDSAHYDFALTRQLQVHSYPAAFIQQSESKFYLIAKGYADYETMELRINNVKMEIGY